MKLKKFQENVDCVEARVIFAKIALILILHASSTFVVLFFFLIYQSILLGYFICFLFNKFI